MLDNKHSEEVELRLKLTPINSFHSVKISDSQPSEVSVVKHSKNAYIFYAILAALLNAFGQVIRGYESGDVISSNFLFSSSWLIVPIGVIVLNRYQARAKGELFTFPWQI